MFSPILTSTFSSVVNFSIIRYRNGTNYTITNFPTISPAAAKLYKMPELNPIFLTVVRVICIAVLVLGLFGNTLVLTVFGTRFSKLKTCERLLMSLAGADLIGTCVVPVKMFLELMDLDFTALGDCGCKIISFLSLTSLTVSALTLLVISIDRFLIVKWPLRIRLEGWKVGMTVFCTWLLAGAVGFNYLLGDRIKLYDHEHDDVVAFKCWSFMEREELRAHTVIIFVVQILLPLVVMTVLYYLIIRELRKASKNQLFKNHERYVRFRLKRNRQATILLVVIVTAYFIFIMPAGVFFLLYIFGSIAEDMTIKEQVTIHTLLQMISMLNSCVNPIIYSKLHIYFRRYTLKLLCSCKFRRIESQKQ